MNFEIVGPGRCNVYLGDGYDRCIGCVTQVLPGVWIFQSRGLYGLLIGKGGSMEAAVRNSGILKRFGRGYRPRFDDWR